MANKFVNFPSDPIFIQADGIPNAWSLRRGRNDGATAAGVMARDNWKLTNTSGLGFSLAPGIGYIPGRNVADQGMYRGITESPLTWSADTNANANPRVDQVIARVLDGAHDTSGSSIGRVEYIEGTPTAGADLDSNRDASAADLEALALGSKSYILLYDILMPGASPTAIPGANIRDRRPYASQGSIPDIKGDTLLDVCGFQPHPGIPINRVKFDSTNDLKQSAALMWLPRRIVANSLRWAYRQDDTVANGGVGALTGTYTINVCDWSGRLIIGSGNNIALAGAAGTRQNRVESFTQRTFEPGWYYVQMGMDTTNTGAIFAWGTTVDTTDSKGNVVPAANLYYRIATGGAAFPTARTILAYTDASSGSANSLGVPIPTLARA